MAHIQASKSLNRYSQFLILVLRYKKEKWGNVGDISMPKLSDLEGVWGRGEGIGTRLGMLGGAINTGS